MKLRKILAGTLAAAMVLTSVPGVQFTATAADSDVAVTAAESTTGIPYGYENLPTEVLQNATVTTTTSDNVGTNVLMGDSEVVIIEAENPWINVKFATPQTVAGVLYYLSEGQVNGAVKKAKVEVKTEGSDEYQTVYQNGTYWVKSNDKKEALFTPVSKVTEVRFSGSEVIGVANRMEVRTLQILTVPENAVYERINQQVLQKNAKSNSYASGSKDNLTSVYKDGTAANAFDGDTNTLWHENYNTAGKGSTQMPSALNPIWIQTSFGQTDGVNNEETVGCLTYRGRPDSYANQANTKGLLSTRISKYVILAADVKSGVPQTGNWAVVKEGTMNDDISVGNAESVLEFAPVKATHIRLVCLSTYESDNFVCAGEIGLYRVNSAYGEGAELNELPKIGKVENGSTTMLPPGYETTNDANTDAAPDESASIVGSYISSKKARNITLWATPDEGYTFAGWKKDGVIVSRNAQLLIKTDEYSGYTPVFAVANSYTEITGISEDHVRASSQMGTNSGNDGPAWYAFNGTESNWWHTKYNSTGSGSDGIPSETNKIYIEARFDAAKNIRQITYTPRTNNGSVLCNAKDYEILVANSTETQPDDKKFVVVCRGQFPDTKDEKTVTLPYTVAATHVRLQISSRYYHGNNYLAAVKVGMKEEQGVNEKNVVNIVPLPEVISSNNDSLGTVSTDMQVALDKEDTIITMTAEPASGCHFVKWLVKDTQKGSVSERTTAEIKEIVNGTRYSYQALFAKDAEVGVSLNETYLTMTVGDEPQTLTPTVKNATNEIVTWTSDNRQVATVDNNGQVTAVGAGETTITANLASDNKSATCTVVVKGKTVDKTTLQTLCTKAQSLLNDGKTYSAESFGKLNTELDAAMDMVASGNSTEEECAEQESKLRDAMNSLVQLYKITVSATDDTAYNDLKLEVLRGKGEYYTEDETKHEKSVYLPMLSKVKVTAPEEVDYAEFAQWQIPDKNGIDGKAMCTAVSYTFYVTENMTLQASYDEVEPVVNIFCTSRYLTSLGKISFVAKRSIDKAYTVVGHGIVITDEVGYNTIYSKNPDALVKDAERTKKAVGKTTGNYGTYDARLKAGKKEKWYGRAYVTYKDSDGDTYTVYSAVRAYEG